MRKRLIYSLVIVATGFLVVLLIWNYEKRYTDNSNLNTDRKTVENLLSLSQKYGEFARLTVPYLREMKLEGSEINIVREVSRQENFTSYIASYESEGNKIYGLLTKPSGDMPPGGYKAVLFLHGYIQPNLYKTTLKYENYVDYLARSGFVVFKIDYRGHGQSEGEATGAYYSGDYVIDAVNAYESLKKLDYVGDDRVGLWGHSMSGNVVLRSLAVRPEIKAAVIWAGAVFSYSDQQKYGISDRSFVRDQAFGMGALNRRTKLFETVGEFSSDSDFWHQVAATNYLGDINTVVSLFHSSNDNVVNIGYSKDLLAALKNAGVNSEFNEYKSGGHNIDTPAFGDAMQKTVEWFNLHLN